MRTLQAIARKRLERSQDRDGFVDMSILAEKIQIFAQAVQEKRDARKDIGHDSSANADELWASGDGGFASGEGSIDERRSVGQSADSPWRQGGRDVEMKDERDESAERLGESEEESGYDGEGEGNGDETEVDTPVHHPRTNPALSVDYKRRAPSHRQCNTNWLVLCGPRCEPAHASRTNERGESGRRCA